jgi:hypothetical protein
MSGAFFVSGIKNAPLVLISMEYIDSCGIPQLMGQRHHVTKISRSRKNGVAKKNGVEYRFILQKY